MRGNQRRLALTQQLNANLKPREKEKGVAGDRRERRERGPALLHLALGRAGARNDGILSAGAQAAQTARIGRRVDLENKFQVHEIVDKYVILEHDDNLEGRHG